MASSSIFSQYLQPVRSVADYRADMDRAELAGLQVEGARRENAIKALLADQSVKKQNALQQIAAGWTPQTTMEDRITSLRGNPLTFGEADSLEKSMLDRKKTTADIAKTQGEADSKKLADAQKRLEVAGQAFGFVRDNPTIESAQAAILGLLQAGVYDENGAQAAWARVQSNPTPEGIRALATQAFQQALSAKEQLPQYFNQNRGGTYAVVGVNPVTGAATDAQSAPITQSADNAATNARIVAEGAANRAVTMRGQNLTDARARDANQAGKIPPGYRYKADGSLEAIPGGPADIKAGEAGKKAEARRKGQIAQAESVLGTIADAKALVGNTTAGVGGLAAGVPATSARNLQSKLETIKANLGFDRLQQMRDESPTGGALGGVAVQELIALQSTVASLDQLQSPAELTAALDKIDRHYRRWADVVQQAEGGSGGASGTWGSQPAAGKTVDFGSLK